MEPLWSCRKNISINLNKDEESLNGRRSPNNSLVKGNKRDDSEPQSEEPSNFRTTYEMFSSRYNKLPKDKIFSHFDVDDEEEEKTALDSKEANLLKLKTPSIFHKNSDRMISIPESTKEETKKTSYEEMENNGMNTYTFFFHGLRIYFINDYGDNFYPVLWLKLRDTNYSKDIRIDGSFVSQSQLNASFYYYNSINGYWEPCIESLDIEFFYDMQGESKVFQVKGKELINMNISPSLISVINTCWDSWNQAQVQIEKDRRRSRSRGSDSFKDSADFLSEDSKLKFEESKTSSLSELTSGLYSGQNESNLVDIATPYKITNYTGLTIFIETLFDDKKQNYILKDGNTTKIAISYEKQAHRGSNGIISKLSDDVKIQFEGLYLPIKSKLSL